jgi:hypothetical protein
MVAQTGAKTISLTVKIVRDVSEHNVSDADIRAISLEHNSTQSSVMHARAQAIACARNLSVDEYERLRAQLSAPGADASDADRNAVSKFALSMTYRVPIDTIEVEFVMEYDDPEVIRAFHNLSDMCCAMREGKSASESDTSSSSSALARTTQRMARALETMREHERACMRVIASRGDTTDVEAIEEMNFAHTYETHRIPYIILVGIGIDDGIFDTRVFERDYVDSRADAFGRSNHAGLWQSVLYHFKIKQKRLNRGRAFPSNGCEVIDWLRQILVSAYLMNLVLIGGTTYKLAHSDSFAISRDFDISPANT